MTNENNEKISKNAAQDALDSIVQMERTSLQQSIPPVWFGIAMSLAIGTLVFIIAAGLRDYYVFPIIAIPIIMASRLAKTQAIPKTMPMGSKGVFAMIGLVICFLALIAAGRIFTELYAMVWMPIVVGAIAAIIVYWLSVAERNDYLKKIDGE